MTTTIFHISRAHSPDYASRKEAAAKDDAFGKLIDKSADDGKLVLDDLPYETGVEADGLPFEPESKDAARKTVPDRLPFETIGDERERSEMPGPESEAEKSAALTQKLAVGFMYQMMNVQQPDLPLTGGDEA